jgi:hypothetical protein
MEQRDGVAPTGNANEIARLWRESPQQIRFYLNPIHGGTASNFQNQ